MYQKRCVQYSELIASNVQLTRLHKNINSKGLLWVFPLSVTLSLPLAVSLGTFVPKKRGSTLPSTRISKFREAAAFLADNGIH